METQKREKWDKLTGEERNLLLAIVEIFKGSYIGRREFARTMHSLLTDFPGREVMLKDKRAPFVKELWHEYEWRRKKLDLKNRHRK